VWRAVDETSGREVAVKTLRARSAVDDRPGFGLVYASVAALSHPGIARVHHYGEEPASGGPPAIAYLVRDLVPGPTLEERLAGGSLPAAEALRYVASVADALAAAHGVGVVHGNLVPANVIGGPAGVQVTDFGLAALREHPPDERFQSVLSYAAPERLSGGPATTASDMYSLGVLFVACLSGIAAAGTSESPPVNDPATDPVTPGLAALWAACLGASPRERPSAAHVAFMSRQAVAALPMAASAGADEGIEPGRDVAGRRGAPAAGARAAEGAPAARPAAARPAIRHTGAQHGDQIGSPPTPRRRRLSVASPGRGGLIAICAAAAGVAVAAVVLTQFLTSPAAQTTGASATPSVRVTATRQASTPEPTADPVPSADATSSVLTSASPPPLQVLGQIQSTIRRGVASGQIRQDVGVDLGNLLQPVQTDLAAGDTSGVAQIAGGLKAKLATRLSEGAITKGAVAELDRELATLVKSVSAPG
jgi:serine/threonine protein kinase